MKKTLLLTFLLSAPAFANDFLTGVDSAPRTSSCIKNTPCIAASSHWANAINTTGQSKIIYVRYKLCPQNEDCKIETYRVVVGNGQWMDSKIISMMVKYHYNGDFRLVAQTFIYNEQWKELAVVSKTGKIQVHG